MASQCSLRTLKNKGLLIEAANLRAKSFRMGKNGKVSHTQPKKPILGEFYGKGSLRTISTNLWTILTSAKGREGLYNSSRKGRQDLRRGGPVMVSVVCLFGCGVEAGSMSFLNLKTLEALSLIHFISS